MATADNLTLALQGKMLNHLQESSIQALERLQDIFNKKSPPPLPTHPTNKGVITQEIQET